MIPGAPEECRLNHDLLSANGATDARQVANVFVSKSLHLFSSSKAELQSPRRIGEGKVNQRKPGSQAMIVTVLQLQKIAEFAIHRWIQRGHGH